ncbi:MAG: hypothetical protein WD426_03750 [Anditalea sp.]
MERTSLITRLMVALAADEENIYLEKDLPDTVSLQAYFEDCPYIPEKAEISESTEDTDQGRLITQRISTNIHRDEYFHARYFFPPLLIYIETLNGERIYLGAGDNPARMQYSRQSGAALGDANETNMIFTHTAGITA